MKKVSLALMAILGFGLLFTSCTKKEYVDSNSDLQAITSHFTISPQDWQSTGDGSYAYGVNLQELDQDIVQNGAIWTFISFDNGNNYESISTSYNGYTFYGPAGQDTNGNYGVTIDAVGSTTTSAAPNFSVIIKVVSIPSTESSQLSNINFKDYNAVKTALHLKD
ncbi:MAG TPA: hypothetical protein VGB84_07130 [Arachidicoccus sp.]